MSVRAKRIVLVLGALTLLFVLGMWGWIGRAFSKWEYVVTLANAPGRLTDDTAMFVAREGFRSRGIDPDEWHPASKAAWHGKASDRMWLRGEHDQFGVLLLTNSASRFRGFHMWLTGNQVTVISRIPK